MYYEKYEEEINTGFEGTVIDIETIGDFGKAPWVESNKADHLARFQQMKITTVGVLNDNTLQVFIAKNIESLDNFQQKAVEVMREARTPTYAFNKSFEEGCFYWNSNREILDIDFELQASSREKKIDAVKDVGIANYDDPYFDVGKMCVDAFQRGELDEIIQHNRACLLKESQILLKRGAKKYKTQWLDLEQ